MDARGNVCRSFLKSEPLMCRPSRPVKILAARPEDSGTYVCTARSGGGSAEARVEVSVEGQPRTSVDEPQLLVVEGRTATLRCHVNGKITPPRATLAPTLPRQRQWLRDSEMVFQFRDIMGTFTSNLLTLKQVSQRL